MKGAGNHGMVSVANSGTGGVVCEFDGDVKASLIVIAAIDTMESKLGLRVIGHGTRVRCEGVFRARFAREMRGWRRMLPDQANGRTD
jgi:hypothetical protein